MLNKHIRYTNIFSVTKLRDKSLSYRRFIRNAKHCKCLLLTLQS